MSVAILLCLGLAPFAQAQKVEFRKALELATGHSAGMGIAKADQIRAKESYREVRNAYVPQVTFGSGLAQTWGYPMSIEGSAPSLFNVSSSSTLFNLGQRDFMRAAHTDWDSASASLDNQRNSTLLETAVTYIQLDQDSAQLQDLQQESTQADRLETISRERLQEGIDTKVDLTRASLNAARIRLRIAELQGNIDLLRQRLSQLTGLDARELQTDSQSIPPLPEISQQENLVAQALANSPAVKAADEKAKAAQQRAQAEHKQWYPEVDLVGNYGYFTKYNNLNLLFPTGQFSANNATFGVEIRFPFVNMAGRSRASVADADALKAQEEAETVREQVSNDALRLQRSVQQLAAARDVSRLESELAQADVEVVQTKTQAGTATIKDQENARIESLDKQAALLDAQFQLARASLQLLQITGTLEQWALPQ